MRDFVDLIRRASNLEQLVDALNDARKADIDLSDISLKTFEVSTSKPKFKDSCYSWDDTHVIVMSCEGYFYLLERIIIESELEESYV